MEPIKEQDDYAFFRTVLDMRFGNDPMNLMLVLLGVKRGCILSLPLGSTENRIRFEETLHTYGASFDVMVLGEKHGGAREYFVSRPGAGPTFARTFYQKHGPTGRFLGYPVVYEELPSGRTTDRYEIRYVWVEIGEDDTPNRSTTIFQFMCRREDYFDLLLERLVAWRGEMIATLQEKGLYDPQAHSLELQLVFHPRKCS